VRDQRIDEKGSIAAGGWQGRELRDRLQQAWQLLLLSKLCHCPETTTVIAVVSERSCSDQTRDRRFSSGVCAAEAARQKRIASRRYRFSRFSFNGHMGTR
jgi:hypothetical protein